LIIVVLILRVALQTLNVLIHGRLFDVTFVLQLRVIIILIVLVLLCT